jgi:pimeloyl-ACP methyl ester carboxylesterase
VTATAAPQTPFALLTERYDPELFELARPRARVRLAGAGSEPMDVVIEGRRARLEPAARGRPDALITADATTWRKITQDAAFGLRAFADRRLMMRHDMHLGVGFLAATSAAGAGGLRMRQVDTSEGSISIAEAGSGPAAILVHGLGATKVSMLPTLAALARTHRAIAIDLPGFGDSVKPIRARYHAPYFARAVVALLDALEIDRADLVGNSMGGRVAIEAGLRTPDRVRRLGLLAPSLAWLRDRPWAPLLRLVVPQLGLIQPAPRRLIETIVQRAIPTMQQDDWTAAGVDEFLRSYLSPRGRAAFYAAARNIYLEEPRGPRGLWTRLAELAPPSLFIWGRRDTLVPIAFANHVRRTLPSAEHLELACGHVPQLESPGRTHRALSQFFARG